LTRQIRQHHRITLAPDNGPQHVPTTGTHHVRSHAGQLDVGVLQGLLDAVDHLHLLTHQLHSLPRQIPQLTHRLVWHKTRLQKPVLEQLGDPLTVLDVGLTPRHRLDVLGVAQDQLEEPLEQVPDRLPVHPGRFHRNVGDPFISQPVRQRQELVGFGAEGANLLSDLPLDKSPKAGDDRLLVDIQAGATGMQDLHA
jgi:hypothetical protein